MLMSVYDWKHFNTYNIQCECKIRNKILYIYVVEFWQKSLERSICISKLSLVNCNIYVKFIFKKWFQLENIKYLWQNDRRRFDLPYPTLFLGVSPKLIFIIAVNIEAKSHVISSFVFHRLPLSIFMLIIL